MASAIGRALDNRRFRRRRVALLAIALRRAIRDLLAPPLRGVICLSVLLTIATFVVLWAAAAVLFLGRTIFEWHPLDFAAHALGIIAVLGLSWLIFPAVATIVISCFLERIAAAVEHRDYPGRGPPRRASIREMVATTLRLMALTVLVNILALPGHVLLPGLNFFVFLGLNGYLFGREYFEVVALRRLDPMTTGAMRRRFAGQVFVGGIVIAALFAVPVVNLVAPVLAVALMVHVFEGLRDFEPQYVASRSG